MDNFGVISLEDLADDGVKNMVKKSYKWSQAEQFSVLDMIRKFFVHHHSTAESNLLEIIDKLKNL